MLQAGCWRAEYGFQEHSVEPIFLRGKAIPLQHCSSTTHRESSSRRWSDGFEIAGIASYLSKNWKIIYSTGRRYRKLLCTSHSMTHTGATLLKFFRSSKSGTCPLRFSCLWMRYSEAH